MSISRGKMRFKYGITENGNQKPADFRKENMEKRGTQKNDIWVTTL
jgi:hypothetical protein